MDKNMWERIRNAISVSSAVFKYLSLCVCNRCLNGSVSLE